MSAPAIVRLAGVRKSFRDNGEAVVDVLRDVDLTIAAGDNVSLIGPSGSGKSTLLGLIAGLRRPDAGTIEIDGVAIDGLGDIERARMRARRIGIVLQSDNLIPYLSARENVELAIAFAGRVGRRAARERAMELLDRFGVAHRAGHRPRHLSGGEAQRVALAISLANDPALLLADEVAAQLDEVTAAHVIDELLSSDRAVLFVTHDLSLADRANVRLELRGQGVATRDA